ncbi:hypothetical protein [Pectinatus frisingensis]|jgi:hypothetical protein|uniref:hypothetical protein n=1 Tax=Pectinatus frisingensis TaxID=865 RepID=UPI0018C76FB1|nr:hypothetical protein [Pectinatus frisingensis]
MHRIKDNTLFINSKYVKFDFDIRDTMEYFGYVLVLLSIPFTKSDINNIYCVNKFGEIVWRVEDLNLLYPNLKNLPYEQMGIKDGILHASDFYGRNYMIDLDTGKINGCKIVK